MPTSSPLHIYAALAEQERDFISLRTKAALPGRESQRQKAWGFSRQSGGHERSQDTARADAAAVKVIGIIGPMRERGMTSAGDRRGAYQHGGRRELVAKQGQANARSHGEQPPDRMNERGDIRQFLRFESLPNSRCFNLSPLEGIEPASCVRAQPRAPARPPRK